MLTAKQEAFANAIIAGASPVEAYREAGYSQRMSKAAQSVEAQKLLANPKIALKIETARAEAAENALWSREAAIERLQMLNDVSYSRLAKTGAENGLQRPDLSAFLESLDRLNDLCGVGDGTGCAVPVFYFDPYGNRSDGDSERLSKPQSKRNQK